MRIINRSLLAIGALALACNYFVDVDVALHQPPLLVAPAAPAELTTALGEDVRMRPQTGVLELADLDLDDRTDI